MKEEKNKLTIPSTAGVLDCFNTTVNKYSNGSSEFNLISNNNGLINAIFISGLFSYLHKNRNLYEEQEFIIRTEDLRKFLGYSKGGKSRNIKEDLLEINNIYCVIRGEIMGLAEIRIQGRYTRVKSTYLHELAKAMRENSKRGYNLYGSSYMSLVYANIVSTKNNAASEITIEICKLVERRGQITTKAAHISLNQIIKRCQALRTKINNADTNSRKNQILKEDMERALILLETQTSLYREYVDLEITYPDKINLINTMGLITITHRGKIIEEKGIEKNEDR